MRDIGSLIFETPIQHDYEEGVEVRSLLSTEQLEEIDGRLAIVDTSPTSGMRVVRFWVDEPSVHEDSVGEARSPLRTEQIGISTPPRRHTEGECSRESPEFGGGVDYHDLDSPRRERLPEGTRESPPKTRQNNTPPEDQNPRGCSLHSMEPLRDWICRGADMTSASEFEASLRLLEDNPPDIRDYNANIREERWTHFSLEGVRFPAMTVDVIQRGEALAVFERDLIIHFQQISRAAALYVRALLGGVKRTLEVYRRVDDTAKNYPWAALTTEETWHSHAEGALMVALSSEPPSRSLEKRTNIESYPKLSSCLDDVIPFLESCVECRREWFDGILTGSAGGWSICDTSDNWLTELEVCGKKVSGNWGSSPDGYSATPGLCQDSLKAFGNQ